MASKRSRASIARLFHNVVKDEMALVKRILCSGKLNRAAVLLDQFGYVGFREESREPISFPFITFISFSPFEFSDRLRVGPALPKEFLLLCYTRVLCISVVGDSRKKSTQRHRKHGGSTREKSIQQSVTSKLLPHH